MSQLGISLLLSLVGLVPRVLPGCALVLLICCISTFAICVRVRIAALLNWGSGQRKGQSDPYLDPGSYTAFDHD